MSLFLQISYSNKLKNYSHFSYEFTQTDEMYPVVHALGINEI